MMSFFCYTGYTNKPMQITIMHAIFIEEFSRGCDIIGSDAFVCAIKQTENANRVRDAVAELTHNQSSQQKRMMIFWWWSPKDGTRTAVDVDLFSSGLRSGKRVSRA